MLSLRELQSQMRLALLGGSPGDALSEEIVGGAFSPAQRLAVYRNNVFASLTDALKDTFPAVCRLVGEPFFSYAAHEFIAALPPSRPSLAEYGSQFSEFLSQFPPCQALTYLPDVARFEWLINEAAQAPNAAAASAPLLGAVALQDAPFLVVKLMPSFFYLSSPYPVNRIWRANRNCATEDDAIDLDSGGVFLEVSRQQADVVFRSLDGAAFMFRSALAEGSSLGIAIARAMAMAPDFDAPAALAALFNEGAVTTVELASCEQENEPC